MGLFELLRSAVEVAALAAELAGAIIVISVATRAFVVYAARFARTGGRPPNVLGIRVALGRGLVLGLEFFVAADIIKTIFAPTREEVFLLAVIVAIRTGLALSLEYEIRKSERDERPADGREG